VSYIVGIWKTLRLLLPDQDAYRRWPHLPNRAPLLAGQPPIERMSAGQVADLYAVRDWLDGWGLMIPQRRERWARAWNTSTMDNASPTSSD
jgi:hypothetical protein